MIASAATPAARLNPDNMLLVRMKEVADLSQEATLPRGAERRTAVWSDLVDTAERTQQPAKDVIEGLAADGLVTASRTIPIGNAIALTVKDGAQQAVIDALRGVDAVGSILANKGKFGTAPAPAAAVSAAVSDAVAGAAAATAAAPVAASTEAEVAWGVQQIGAPAAWAKGVTGAGVTVGILDSGVDTQHEALRASYRGTAADGSQTHDYNWVDTAGFQTGTFNPTPNDKGGHGSHVAGSVLGATATDKIGVAPGAKFVAAQMVFEDSLASTISALDGLQFMLAPTKTDGTAPDPTKGVDVVNNSWGAGEWERLETRTSFDALKAAGILLVNSAGNEGPRPGTLSAPGAFPGHISVAASDQRDGITRFSSRGPSEFGGGNPDVAAPGSRIVSARAGGGLTTMDGTSMAAPHVTGAVALMLEADPQASYEQIHAALTQTATDIDAAGEDIAAGAGRINVDAAIDHLTGAAPASAD